MANIAYLASGDFTSAVPYKVVSFYDTFTAGNGTYVTSASPYNISFTASDAGDCSGAFVALRLANNSAYGAVQITVALQQNTGSWTDVITVTETCENVAGALYASMNSMGLAWHYFEFATPQTITTAASTWRIQVRSNSASNAFSVMAGGSGGNHAVVIDTTTSYSSGDNAVIAQGETLVIDQTMTLADLILGVDSILEWENPPVASYTFTLTNLVMSGATSIIIGTVSNPIPAAEQAIWVLTSIKTNQNYVGGQSHTVRIYGERPTNLMTQLASDAASGQAHIITAEDMSADWQAGDQISVFGGDNTSYREETKTISSISGTDITFTANLSANHFAGWFAANWSKKDDCGVSMSGNNNFDCAIVLKLMGVDLSSATSNGVTISGYSSNANSLAEPVEIDTLFSDRNTISVNASAIGDAVDNSYFINRIGRGNYYTSLVSWIMPKGTSVNFQNWAGVGTTNMTVYNATFTDVQICGHNNSNATYKTFSISSTNTTFTRCKSLGDAYGFTVNGVKCIFDDCTADDNTTAYYTTSGVMMIFNRFLSGQDVANTAMVDVQDGYGTIYVRDSYGVLVAGDCLSNAVDGSFVKASNCEGTTNNDIAWFIRGKTQRSGDGLTDTTVHTSGSGKYSIRLEPKSETFDEWSFTIPTGDISGQTMVVAIWIKINSATFYAGTHTNPTLVIDYDNGTEIAAVAADTTDWQLLSVAFTPTTEYGQVTFTLKAKTDASGSDAYFYADDTSVLYPAGYRVDLGGMDLWADALPIAPPIATVASAQDVWTVLVSALSGTGTVGKHVKDKLNIIPALM